MTARGLIGAAGEYAVASELSRRGWVATLTGHNSPDIDILARYSKEPHPQVSIQVKAISPGTRAFPLTTERERFTKDATAWYAFVRFDHDLLQGPTFHLIPWNVVAAVLIEKREGAEAQGKVVKPSRRNFLTEWVDEDLYLDRWDRLLQPVPELALIRRIR